MAFIPLNRKSLLAISVALGLFVLWIAWPGSNRAPLAPLDQSQPDPNGPVRPVLTSRNVVEKPPENKAEGRKQPR